jgi:LacI family transcriptional regulator
MTPTNRTPTIQDVAQRAGVSITTVSRVLNSSAPVGPAASQRVLQAVQELNFVPRAAARRLASQRSDTIGLLLPEIGGPFFSPLLRGIETAAKECGLDLLIHTTGGAEAGAPYRSRLGEHNTDGLLVFTGSVGDDELRRLSQLRFPLVLLHQTPPPGSRIPVVTVENKLGTQKLIEHLIVAHRRRRIVFLQGPDGNEDSAWRERGYRAALQTHGLPFRPELVAHGDFAERTAYQAVQQLLLDGVVFDAIFSGDDEAASGVLKALRAAGLRVPDQVAVAGFDDGPFTRLLTPPLTSVHAPIEQIGRVAVQQLVKCIRRQPCEDEILLPTELVIRQSCGC